MASGHDLAERVRAQFASASSLHGEVRVATTASFGVVSARLAPHAPGAGSPASIAQALIAHADELMYAAKRGGRNRVHANEWGTPQAV
jgi:PleD family two-component response regulator